VILHLVLFTPRADLDDADRHQLVRALERALTEIAAVRRYHVGRRVRTGAAYDTLGPDYEYCGVLEFDDRAGLAAYLAHPAHEELGRLFYVTSALAIAADFDATSTSPADILGRTGT
jgi:hypothetical protein